MNPLRTNFDLISAQTENQHGLIGSSTKSRRLYDAFFLSFLLAQASKNSFNGWIYWRHWHRYDVWDCWRSFHHAHRDQLLVMNNHFIRCTTIFFLFCDWLYNHVQTTSTRSIILYFLFQLPSQWLLLQRCVGWLIVLWIIYAYNIQLK
jgi:hypothetical protein